MIPCIFIKLNKSENSVTANKSEDLVRACPKLIVRYAEMRLLIHAIHSTICWILFNRPNHHHTVLSTCRDDMLAIAREATLGVAARRVAEICVGTLTIQYTTTSMIFWSSRHRITQQLKFAR